jgi:two-component system, NarL family, sensor histidine kinase DesK
MEFIHKYILFPKRFGFAPYLWLLWLVIPLVQMFPYRHYKDWIALVLLAIFVWFYRNSYIITAKLPLWILGQYLITLILIYYQGMLFLFLFTAWVIGSLPIAKQKFRSYLLKYYIALSCGLLIMFIHPFLMEIYSWGDITSTSVFLLFIIFSPLGGRSIRNNYVRSGILKQQNKRYEMLIRRGERDRIARDLHDTLGQSFATITLKAELAQKLLQRNPDKVNQQLIEIQTASRSNLTLVREIVTNLRKLTLTEVLVNLTDKLRGLKINLITEQEELVQKWPLVVQETIAAILQEAPTNVMQYSQASEVHVSFKQTQQQALVVINDDGISFGQIRPGAHGILGMRERISQLQGNFAINSTNHGTTIKLNLPLKESIND